MCSFYFVSSTLPRLCIGTWQSWVRHWRGTWPGRGGAPASRGSTWRWWPAPTRIACDTPWHGTDVAPTACIQIVQDIRPQTQIHAHVQYMMNARLVNCKNKLDMIILLRHCTNNIYPVNWGECLLQVFTRGAYHADCGRTCQPRAYEQMRRVARRILKYRSRACHVKYMRTMTTTHSDKFNNIIYYCGAEHTIHWDSYSVHE